MAAQVAVTTSLADPEGDFDVNLARHAARARGGAARRTEPPAVIFASTNKVYGDLGDVRAGSGRRRLPAGATRLARAAASARTARSSFHTPYGCSKGAADQYVLDYARGYGLPACGAAHELHLRAAAARHRGSGLGRAFPLSARCAGEPISIYGDGRQVRDVLYVDDAVDAYLAALGAHRRGLRPGLQPRRRARPTR